MKKLVRQLKFAHAAEIAAYYAYEGHWRSVTDKNERYHIYNIALDELKHIRTIESILSTMNSIPSNLLDFCGKLVGQIVGFACHHTGWRLPMIIAGKMEKIGTSSYEKIALEAAENGKFVLAAILLEMAEAERQHDLYFEVLRASKK